jgi:DNA-directed RNA polymerase subunit RPC12/RpoP
MAAPECRVCGELVDALYEIGFSSAPIAYVCPNGHHVEPVDVEREVRCPSCKKKLADHLYGYLVVNCPRCHERSAFDR